MAANSAPGSLLQAAAGGSSLLFRQFFDANSGTFTYLLAVSSSGKGVLNVLGIDLLACLDTQVHADQVTGSWRSATGIGWCLAAAPWRYTPAGPACQNCAIKE
jgi:hypothetical protein